MMKGSVEKDTQLRVERVTHIIIAQYPLVEIDPVLWGEMGRLSRQLSSNNTGPIACENRRAER